MTENISCPEDVFEKAGNMFTHSYTVIKAIIKYLGYADLLTACQLSKTWQHIVRQHLQKNRKCHYMTLHAPTDITTKHSNDLAFIKYSNAEQDMNYMTENFINKCMGKHGLVLGFENGGWMSKTLSVKNSPIASTLKKQFKSNLAARGNYSLICGRGIIGSVEATTSCQKDSSIHSDINKILALQYAAGSSMHSSNSDHGSTTMYINTPDYIAEIDEATTIPNDNIPLSMVFIPEQYGVNIKLINFNSKVFKYIMRANSKSLVDKKFNELCEIKENEELKAFMYISTEFDSREKNFLTSLLSRRDKFAYGGGLATQIQGFTEEQITSIGIAISGKNVSAASIVIPQTVYTKNTFDKYVQELKSAHLPEGNSIAFLFSCCGRCFSFYTRDRSISTDEAYSVETVCFRKHFPHTPLFGFYCDGEFGHTYPPVNDLIPLKKRRANPLMSFSAVIVLVSFL